MIDPYGVLNEGEIHFKSSKNLKDPLEDSNPNILLGDVLVRFVKPYTWHLLDMLLY